MIDPDLIDAFGDPDRQEIRRAIMVLAGSGIIHTQLSRAVQQLASGSSTEDDSKLAERVREYRIKARALESLQHLGDSINQQLQEQKQ